MFVPGLHFSILSVVATFSCSTLAEAVMRTLKCEHAHMSHHQSRALVILAAMVRRIEDRITKVHNGNNRRQMVEWRRMLLIEWASCSSVSEATLVVPIVPWAASSLSAPISTISTPKAAAPVAKRTVYIAEMAILPVLPGSLRGGFYLLLALSCSGWFRVGLSEFV